TGGAISASLPGRAPKPCRLGYPIRSFASEWPPFKSTSPSSRRASSSWSPRYRKRSCPGPVLGRGQHDRGPASSRVVVEATSREDERMTDTWSIKGAWFKNCNCDPGCPCDFNQAPTHGYCEGIIAMRIDEGHFGDVPLTGLKFAGAAWWPGRLEEGNGHIIPIVDAAADEEQRRALLTIL